MKKNRCKVCAIVAINIIMNVVLTAQKDSLWLSNGGVKVGSYKVSYNKRQIESKVNPNEVYEATNTLRLSAKGEMYAKVSISAGGGANEYMAKRLSVGKVSLYGVDFSAGYFNTNSVAQSFYYFEKEGVMTYVNKANLEAFYKNYFGSCYDVISGKSHYYSKNSLIEVLNAYNKCLNPDFKEQLVEPDFKVYSIYLTGGVHWLNHKPKYISYEDGEFMDEGSDFGVGFNSELRSKFNLGLELNYGKHSVKSPTIKSYINPGLIISDFSMIGAKLTCSYSIDIGKLLIKPGIGVGFSKMLNYKETRIQPIVTTPPFNADFFTFKQVFNNFIMFSDIGYRVKERMMLFARLNYAISLTKSRAGFNYFPVPSPEGQHNVFGGMVSLGIQFDLKKTGK